MRGRDLDLEQSLIVTGMTAGMTAGMGWQESRESWSWASDRGKSMRPLSLRDVRSELTSVSKVILQKSCTFPRRSQGPVTQPPPVRTTDTRLTPCAGGFARSSRLPPGGRSALAAGGPGKSLVQVEMESPLLTSWFPALALLTQGRNYSSLHGPCQLFDKAGGDRILLGHWYKLS